MAHPDNRSARLQRSRRNLLRLSAVAGSALALSLKPKPADALPCAAAIRCNCFLKGTLIRTVEGERKVEDLAIGDLLPTVFGGLRPVQWIARYRFRRTDTARPWVRDVLPVRIARSALGADLPHTDLFVTKGHSLLIDGLLVPVHNLMHARGVSLHEAEELDELAYFHIKLESHDVLWAHGVPCDSLLDVDENALNFAEYLREYGSLPPKAAPCAPWVGFGPRVELKSRLRSALTPWIDRRETLDIIRDKLEEGEFVL